MYNIKNTVFLDFTKRQKAMLCAFLRTFTKNNQNLSAEEVLNKFIEDETYYYEINNPHFYFVVENLEKDDFIRDLKRYIEAVFKDIEFKKAQEPYLEKQKEIAKDMRRKASEYKMKHEKPSLKQLKYYKNLCKNHKIEPKDTETATKFDLKTWIGEVLEKYA